MIFVGVDWAQAHHDVHVQDEYGKRLGGGRLPEGVDGIARFHGLAGRHVDEPGEVVVGIETDRGLFVTALVATGYQVLRSALREFYPGALVAFDDLSSADALEVLRIAPTPELARALSQSKIAAALRRGGRQRRIDERAAENPSRPACRAARLPTGGLCRHGGVGEGWSGRDRHHGHPDRRPGGQARSGF